jgi:ribA/ribD-fused uncharacterized protein
MDKDIAGFFLSGWYVFDNFAAFQINWKGKDYPTSEHAFQAAHFIDTRPDIAEKIRNCKSPRLAADFANENCQFEDPEWKAKRLEIMEDILRHKLNQHEIVKQTLLATKDKTIVEMNDNDEFWGWGKNHNGNNNLGEIWMKLREEII